MKPLTLTLYLLPADAELLRRLCRARGGISLQNAVVALLREWDAVPDGSADRASEEVTYRHLYFDLASSLEGCAYKLLEAVGQEAVVGVKKQSKKRRKK